jgi:hypothetical protein
MKKQVAPSGNASNSYSGGCRFESHPGHRLSGQIFVLKSLETDAEIALATTGSFWIYPLHCHPNTWRYTIGLTWATETILSKPQRNKHVNGAGFELQNAEKFDFVVASNSMQVTLKTEWKTKNVGCFGDYTNALLGYRFGSVRCFLID